MQLQSTVVASGAPQSRRTDALLLAGLGPLFLPSVAVPSKHETGGELRERVERDEQFEQRAVDAQLPRRGADVLVEAERNLDRSSRAFRRLSGRQDAVEQFRDDRSAFRQALVDAGADSAGKPAKTLQPLANAEPTGKSPETSSPKTSEPAKSAPVRAASAPAQAAAETPAPPTPVAAAQAVVRVAQPSLPAMDAKAARNSSAPIAAVGRSERARPSGTASRARNSTIVQSTRGEFKAKLTTARAAKPQAADPAERAENIERIVRVVRSRLSANKSITIIRLDPPELGNLSIRLDLNKDVLSLRIETQTDTAHRLLKEELETLRGRLESAGIQLERVEIRPPDHSARNPEAGDAQQHGQEAHERGSDADQERSRDSESSDRRAEREQDAITTEPAAESLVNLIA